jgi:hypothetical protein
MNSIRKNMVNGKGGKVSDAWFMERSTGSGKNCISNVWTEKDQFGVEHPYSTDYYGRIAPAVTVETLQDNCDSAVYLIERERLAVRGWSDYTEMWDPENPQKGAGKGPFATLDKENRNDAGKAEYFDSEPFVKKENVRGKGDESDGAGGKEHYRGDIAHNNKIFMGDRGAQTFKKTTNSPFRQNMEAGYWGQIGDGTNSCLQESMGSRMSCRLAAAKRQMDDASLDEIAANREDQMALNMYTIGNCMNRVGEGCNCDEPQTYPAYRGDDAVQFRQMADDYRDAPVYTVMKK